MATVRPDFPVYSGRLVRAWSSKRPKIAASTAIKTKKKSSHSAENRPCLSVNAYSEYLISTPDGEVLSILNESSHLKIYTRRFGPETVAKIRSIPGRRWDAEQRCWMIPCSPERLREILHLFRATPYYLSGQIAARLDQEMTLQAMGRNSRRAYMFWIQDFLYFLNRPPGSDDAEAIHEYLSIKGKSSRVNTVLLIRAALRFLYNRALRTAFPDIPGLKKDRILPTIISKQEVLRILKECRNPKHRLLLMLVYSAGLRVSEAVSLRSIDIQMDRNLIHIRRAKGRKDRYVLLSRIVLDDLKRVFPSLEGDFWIFPGQKNGRHLSIRSAQQVFKNALEKAKIHRNISIHGLRHAFATHLLENGTDIRVIQKLLGHSSLQTTQIYTHVTKQHIHKIISPLDQMNEP